MNAVVQTLQELRNVLGYRGLAAVERAIKRWGEPDIELWDRRRRANAKPQPTAEQLEKFQGVAR